jgi:dTDP-4-dehydrorhamnose 3,5-epimerase
MQVISTVIPDVLVIEPKVHRDGRGFFVETFNLANFETATGIKRQWVQDNHSRSTKGVLRGLHFQNPKPQGKLVRCSSGAVFDVAVDVRSSSPTFLDWFGVELSEKNHRQLWVPEGFAHGFVVVSDVAEVLYKTTDYFHPQHDRGVRWDDPTIGVEWPLSVTPIVSQKDGLQPTVEAADFYR